jgi:hypothetical protein
MNKIIIEEKNGSWVASWTDKEGMATGRSPIAALKMLLETDEMITRKDDRSEKIKEEITSLLNEYVKQYPHHKPLVDLIGVRVFHNHDLLCDTMSYDVAMSVVTINRFRISEKQITDSEYLKYLTERSLYKILQLFNKIFVTCVKDSTRNSKFGNYYMATNPLVPEDVLFMHPHTYMDLSLLGSKMGMGMYY